MKTTIYENEAGRPVLSIEGIEAPVAVAREYLRVIEMLHPKAEAEEPKVINKEVKTK